MITKKTIIFAMFSTILLTGCQTTYSDTLSQKLHNKSPDKKGAILASECANEIKITSQKHKEASIQHTERMKEICEEMTKQPIKIPE